jgi:hypothetical protein
MIDETSLHWHGEGGHDLSEFYLNYAAHQLQLPELRRHVKPARLRRLQGRVVLLESVSEE